MGSAAGAGRESEQKSKCEAKVEVEQDRADDDAVSAISAYSYSSSYDDVDHVSESRPDEREVQLVRGHESPGGVVPEREPSDQEIDWSDL